MTMYAAFDTTVSGPSPVLGWYDTNVAYNPPVDYTKMLAVTDAQIAARGLMSNRWAVSGGALVPYNPTPTPLTLPQQASNALYAGVEITSTSTPALNGLYPVDAATQSHLQAEMISLLVSGGTAFADGSTSVVWPDMASPKVNHTFTAAEFKLFATAIYAYVAALYKVVNGSSTTIPPASVTIA